MTKFSFSRFQVGSLSVLTPGLTLEEVHRLPSHRPRSLRLHFLHLTPAPDDRSTLYLRPETRTLLLSLVHRSFTFTYTGTDV